MTIRILLADDHQMIREGLRALLEKEMGIEVVGEAPDGEAAIEQVARTAPHIVVMDVGLPQLNGIEAARRIIDARHNVKVIALSAHPDHHFVREMLQAGASGYVLKQTASEELVRAIREVMDGRTYLSPEVTLGVVNGFVRAPAAKAEDSAFATLSEREREVLQRITEGLTTKETAATLGVSIKTIETHRRNIMEKLGLHSIAELTKYAIREGLTSTDF
jgi:DNA-binding NarL/FixJ family response regulator